MKKISRRELAGMVAAMTAARVKPLRAQAATQAPQSSGYIGPLTGITNDVADRGFDPVAFTRDLTRRRHGAYVSAPARALRRRRGSSSCERG